jgi:hypothetical protein
VATVIGLNFHNHPLQMDLVHGHGKYWVHAFK